MEFEGRSRIQGELGMAPLIDVVFLLLLFFMLTSTFTDPQAIDLTLPTSSSGNDAPETPIAVAIDDGGVVFLNGESVTLDALEAAIAEQLGADADDTVTLSSDDDVRVQRMVDVIDRIRAAGARNLAFATSPAPPTKSAP